MKKENILNYRFGFVIFVLLMMVFIEFHVYSLGAGAPEKVLIRVETPDGRPDVNAFCKGDVITGNEAYDKDDVALSKIDSVYELINARDIHVEQDKGYYLFKTGLGGYVGDYEIRIVCTSAGYKTIGYTIINKTNIPCEILDGGYFLC